MYYINRFFTKLAEASKWGDALYSIYEDTTPLPWLGSVHSQKDSTLKKLRAKRRGMSDNELERERLGRVYGATLAGGLGGAVAGGTAGALLKKKYYVPGHTKKRLFGLLGKKFIPAKNPGAFALPATLASLGAMAGSIGNRYRVQRNFYNGD